MARIMTVTVNSMVSSPTNGELPAVMKFSGKDRKEGDGTDAPLETMQKPDVSTVRRLREIYDGPDLRINKAR